MKNKHLKFVVANIALAAVIAVVAGCKSASYDKGVTASTALQSTANEISATSTKLTDVLGALNNLTFKSEGDLRKQYDAFTASTKSLDDSLSKLDSSVDALKTKSADYLANWSNQLTNIANVDVKQRGEDRKAQVSAALAGVTDSYQGVKTSLAPFLSDVKDIKTYLGTDLTAAGIANIKDIVSKTKVDAVPLRDSIKKLQGDFSNLSAALSPILPASN